MATAKSNSEGHALPKRRTEHIGIEALISKSLIFRTPLVLLTYGKKKKKVRKAKKVSACLLEYVEKFIAVAEFSSAPSGINFGQLLREVADEARKQHKRLVAKTVLVTQALVNKPLGSPRRLIVVAVKAYGTVIHALLDTGAV